MEDELIECTHHPKTIEMPKLQPKVIYEKPDRHYKYETESQSKLLLIIHLKQKTKILYVKLYFPVE